MLDHPVKLGVLFFSWLSLLVDGCPSECECKWKQGKQTVSCERTNLNVIPDNLETSTQVLHYTGNVLKHLPAELFLQKKLVNLQRIYLSECHIRTISDSTFRGLTNLVELDLSKNELLSVPTGAFVHCPALMRLTLNDNPIKVLKKLSFNHLSYLASLELSRCELHEIEVGAFRELHSLERLFLDDNRLKTIRGSLPLNLKGVELRGNPWECDCHMKDFHSWLQHFNIPNSMEPFCVRPSRLRNRTIRSIREQELACLPDVSPTAFYLELAEGKNVSLLCHVHSVPEAAVSWWFEGRILQNNTDLKPGLRLIYYIEEEDEENKRSELFIYNADFDTNGTFVCSAENPAGVSRSNFTVKIILKEEPIVVIVSFSYEYFIVALVALSALAIVTITLVIVCIVRCRKRQRRRQKAKEIVDFYRETLKHEPSPQPDSLKDHHSEHEDPDLITGVMDSEGYPLDYGLPRLNYYRTLPPNNRVKRQIRRYSNEVDEYQNVRYTVEGYPVQCSVPANVHTVTSPNLLCMRKRCTASAQTVQIDTNTINSRDEILMTESPDEGYGGEPSVVV